TWIAATVRAMRNDRLRSWWRATVYIASADARPRAPRSVPTLRASTRSAVWVIASTGIGKARRSAMGRVLASTGSTASAGRSLLQERLLRLQQGAGALRRL